MSASQLANPGDSHISEHKDGSLISRVESYNAQSYRRYRDHAEHDADDEESDTMSDGIASNESVYGSSGDRDLFDDDEGDFEIDSDEEYDSDEYDS
jgi:hypothetical protein